MTLNKNNKNQFNTSLSYLLCIYISFADTGNLGPAYVTPYYNLPHISWEANDPTFSKKDIFKTFIRLSATFNKVGLATVALFSEFKWNVTGLLIQASYGGDFHHVSLNKE